MKFIINQIQNASEIPNIGGNNKIEVVVAVIAVIFIGITAFLLYVERKLKNLEKRDK